MCMCEGTCVRVCICVSVSGRGHRVLNGSLLRKRNTLIKFHPPYWCKTSGRRTFVWGRLPSTWRSPSLSETNSSTPTSFTLVFSFKETPRVGPRNGDRERPLSKQVTTLLMWRELTFWQTFTSLTDQFPRDNGLTQPHQYSSLTLRRSPKYLPSFVRL